MILSSWLAGLRRTNSRAPRGRNVPIGPIDYVPLERPKRRFGLRPLKLSPCVEMFEARTLLTTTTLEINVTIEADEFNLGNGDVSLREAIVMAHSASEDEVFINLDVNGALPEVFVLDIPSVGDNAETGDLDVTTSKPITIRGSDNTTITVDAPFNDRVFDVGLGANLTLVDLVLDGDSGFTGSVPGAGAGIRNVGTLTVVRSTLQQFETTGNGGAIYNEGMLDLQASVISGNSALGNGGGLNNNQGTVTIDATTFDLNAATGTSNSDGGAIYSDGSLHLQRSLIRRGTAASGQGGGLYFVDTSMAGDQSASVENSTFGQNQASDGAAIWVQGGTLSLTSATIAKNAAGTGLGIGGVGVNAGTVQVQNTVIAENTDSTMPTPNATDVLGTFQSFGNNFIGDADGSTGFSGDTTGSQTGSGVIDPNLQATLTDNGGPTLTYSPIVGTSPLIDAGNVPPVFFGGVEIPLTDQRGAPRSQAVAPDIGAVETGFNGVFVDTTVDEGNDPLGGTGTSLREAVLGVQGAFSGGGYNPAPTIVVLPGVYGLSMGSLGFGPGTSVEVIGFGPLSTEIDAGGNSRVIETQSPDLEVSGVTLRNGDATNEVFKNGGALLNSGMTRLINVRVEDSTATDGGGIASDGTIELQGVTVVGNSATGDGGGLAVGVSSSARIVQSTIAHNQAGGDSGGVGVDGNVEIHESSIFENMAGVNAGGIGVSETGSLLLNSSGVDSNSAESAGGIGTRGETTITFASVSNNVADDGGGIGVEGGRLEVQASNISGNTANAAGGGVYLETLPGAGQSTEASFGSTEIAGNHAIDGGGIFSIGVQLTIDKSTIAENFADVSGGGSGGGLFVLSGEAELKNSTVAMNAAGTSSGNTGGGIFNSGQVFLESVTVSGNSAFTGGGITTESNGTTTAINTIASANTATATDPEVSIDGGSTLLSKGHNVFGFSNSQSGFLLEPNAMGDQYSVSDPMLGPLDFNGGATRTMLPQAGSAALDAGDDSVASATDQRGAPRQLDSMGDPGVIDVGAVEAGFDGVFVNTTNDVPLAMIMGNEVSLRSAIQTANMGSSPVTIILPAGEYSIGEIGQFEDASATGDFDITTTGLVTIIGAGMGLTTIDGAEMDRVLDVHFSANVELRDLSIINGRAEGENGGGIHVDHAHLELLRVELRDNDAINNLGGGSGGAVYTTAAGPSTLIVNDSLIQNNTASLSGGAIYNDFDAVTISGTLLSQNQADSGGAIFNRSGTVTVTSSQFESNMAAGGSGGAINNDSGVLSISSSLLMGNSAMGAGGFGGAIASQTASAELTINDSEFSANTASNFGGAIYAEETATITNSTFEANSSGANGGAIAVEAPLSGNTSLTLTNSTVSGNFATGPGFTGGGLAVGGDADITVTILNSTITQNSADVGGGIHAASTPESPKVELKNSIVSANQAFNFDNDVSGPFSSMAGATGNNLIGEIGTATAILSQSGNVISPLPMLRPLGDYTSQPSFIVTPDELEMFADREMMEAPERIDAAQFEPVEPAVVRTHALLPDSMAIDAGNNTNAPTEDQRGIARPVNATVDIGATEYAPAAISGFVFSDHNANGVHDMDEPALDGVTVYVDLDNDGVLDDFGTVGVYEPGMGDEPFLETDEFGVYAISGLEPFEQYTVRQVEPAGFMQTAPFEVGLGLFGDLTDRVETGQIGGIAVGDFNNDENDDMAVTLEGSGEVVVFLNDAIGGFVASTVGGFTGSQPFSIAAADFDGDTDIDLVVANEGDGTIQLLRNNGSGVFSGMGIDPVDVFGMPAVTGIPLDLAAVNLDGDAAVEVVLVDELNGTFVVLDYDAMPANLVVSQRADVVATNPMDALPSSLVVEDIDDDGARDLIVTTEGDNKLRVFLGTGSGTFNTTAAATVDTGDEPARVRAASLDDDGDLDLVVVNQSSGTATVILNDSSPGMVSFFAATTFGTVVGGETLLLEDFNGDSRPDLLTTSEDVPVLSLLINDGFGNFAEPILFNMMGSVPIEIAAIDLNSDDNVDLAITDANVEQQQVLLLTNAIGGHSLVAPAGVTLNGNNFANHDVVPPGAPTVDSVTSDTGSSSTDELTSDSTLIFNGTAEADSVVEVFIDGSSIGTTMADGAGDWSFDHTGTSLADDTYSVTATATDATGNVSATSSALTVVVDTSAPGTPTVDSVTSDTGASSTDEVTSDNTLIFNGTAAANSLVEVFIDASSIGTTMADGSGDWSFDHTGTSLSDDTYSVTATATDTAGNTSSTSGALTVVVDTSVPGAPSVDSVTDDTGSSSTDAVTSDNMLIFNGTAEANSLVEVFIDGSSIGTTMADGSGDWSFDHTGTALSDDTYLVTATATDAAGNTSSASGALTVVVDTSAPGAPTVDSVTSDTGSSSTDGVTNDSTLIFNGTAAANSVVEVFIDGSSIGTTMADGSGDWSFDHTGTTLSDDDYSITATATDGAGNSSGTSSALTVVVDATAPGAPSVNSVTDDTGDGSDGMTSDNTLVFSGTAEANSVVEVFIDGSSIGTTMSDGAGEWSFDHTGTTLADGTYSLTARSTDASGNVSATSGTLTVVVDTSAPDDPTVDSVSVDTGSSSTDGVTSDNTLIFSGTADANSSVEVFIDGSSVGTTTADELGGWSFDHTGTALSDDGYSITARATDTAGNTSSESLPLTLVVDTSAPSDPTVASVTDDTGASSTDGVTNDNRLIFNGTAEMGSVVEVFIDGSSIGTAIANAAGSWTLDHTGTTLSDDTYSITATATDTAGNTSSMSLTLTVVVDTAAPNRPTVDAVTSDTGDGGDGVTSDNTLVFSGIAEANSVVEVFIDGSSIGTTMADGAGDWSFDHTETPLSDNTYSVTATATDSAGNTSSTSFALTVVVDSDGPGAPTVDSVTSDTGASSTDGVTNDGTLIFSGTADANSTVEVFIDGLSVGTTTADELGGWGFDHTGTTLSDDSYSVTATATDVAGNTSPASLPLAIVVDSIAPDAPTVDSVTTDTGAADDEVTSDNTLVFSGTAAANSVVEVFIGGSSIGMTTANGSGDWSFDHTGTTLSDGTHSVTATATDAAGNTSPASDALSVVVDTLVPGGPDVTSPVGPATVSAVDFSIEGTAEANSLVRIYSDEDNNGMVNGPDEVVASLLLTGGETEFAIDTPLPETGENNFVVTATDAAGNESAPVDIPTITRESIQVSGTVWLDSDENGILDEAGRVEGIAVRVLTLSDGEVVQLGPGTTTNSDGQYSLTFNSLPVEPVIVEFGSMADDVFYRFTLRDVGDDRFDSDVHRLTGQTPPVLLPPNGMIRDAGLIPLTVSIDDAASVDEGQPGDAVTTEFEITLDGPAPHPVTVRATAASGTAVLGDDFRQVASVARTVTFHPGQTSKTVRVPIIGDVQVEDDETFSVTLSMPNGVAIENGGGTANGLIINDDSAIPTVEILPTATVVELNAPDLRAMTFEVRLQGGAVGQDIEIGFETTGVPIPAPFEAAQPGVDYLPRTGTVVIPAGQTSAEVRVTVLSDNLPENDQLFGLDLTGIVSAGTTGAVLGSRTSAVGRIIDDDVVIPEVSIGNADVVEFNAPLEPAMRFPVMLDGSADQTVLVQYSSVILQGDGTATAFVDFEPRFDGVLEIPAGQVSGFIDVRVFGDQDVETDEVIAVEITGATFEDGTDILLGETLGVGTIINDDVATPIVGFAGDSQVLEGRRNEFRQLEFEITLNGPASDDVTVLVSTLDSSSLTGAVFAVPAMLDADGRVAPSDGDFLAFTNRRVVIPKGETSATLAVDIVGDETAENDEELRVRIDGVEGNAMLDPARAQVAGTIRNDDRDSVVVTVDPETTVRETDDPKTSVAEFTVRLDSVANETISVGYRTINTVALAVSGLATPGVDFVPVGATPGSEGVVDFAPGETERTIQVVVLGDRLPESPEDFYVELTSVTGENDGMRPVDSVTGVIIDPIATLDPFASQAKATIFDNDSGLAVVSIQGRTSVVEPDLPGMVPAVLTVSLDSALDDDVVVSWRTRSNGQPGRATSDVDFVAVNAGTVRIPAGRTEASIAVSVLGDDLQEGDERFVVMLDSVVSGPAEISTSEGQGWVRIVDNDFDRPIVRISDTEVVEGDPGDDVDLVFTVELAGRVPDRQVSVELVTERLDEEVPGLARTDGDNRDAFATRRILYFDPNVTTQEFRVRVIPDDRFEADELLFVRLFNANGVDLDDGANQAVGRIINDDFAVPTLTIGSATMLEGDAPGQNVLEFEVTLDADPEQGSIPTVMVDFDTIDVTAIGGDDYQPASGTLMFDENTRSQTVQVPIIGDTMNEGTEEFIVELSNAANADLHPGAFQGLGVIENDDAPDVQFRIDSVTKREGNDGTTDYVFTVTRVGQPTSDVTVDFATEAGTALAGIDFQSQTGQLTFSPGGPATQQIIVKVIADDLPEEEVKSFFVTLDNPVGATIDPEASQGAGVIFDDDHRVFREDGDQELLRIAREIQELIDRAGNDPNNPELINLITTLSRDVLRRLNLDVGLVFITDPVDFLLTDVESRTVGYTSPSGEVTEVANAYYSGDANVELVVIPGAAPGIYGLQLAGVGSGEYATAATLVTADGFATTQTTSGVLNGEFELALDLQPNVIADLRSGVFAELAGSGRDEGAEQNLNNLTNSQLAASEEARQALENLRSEIRDAVNSDDQSLLTNGVFGQLMRRVAELSGDLRDSLKEELEELFGGPLTDLDGQIDPDAEKNEDAQEPDTLDTFWRSLGRSLLGTPGHLLNLSDFFDLTGSNDEAGDGGNDSNENGEPQNDGQNNGAAPDNNGQAQRDGDQQAALMPERYRRLRYWPDGRFAQIDDGKVSPWSQPRQSAKPAITPRQESAAAQDAAPSNQSGSENG